MSGLTEDVSMNSKVVQTLKTSLKERYDFNSDIFRARNGTPKPNGMFDLFGKYSGVDSCEIRKDMVRYAREHYTELSTVCKEAVEYKKFSSFKAWIVKLSLRNTVCDEIALYVLCKQYSRHAIVYTTKGVWTTLHSSGLNSSEIEEKCDLMFIHTDKGFTLCRKVVDCLNKDGEGEAGTPANSKPGIPVTKAKRKTCSIHTVLKETQEREKEKQNKVSAKINVDNILPDSNRCHNTRKTTPLHRRHSERVQRTSCENYNYSDNLDEYHLDSPPNKKQKKHNIAKSLREPSDVRQNAQRMLTRGELQKSVSPKFTRKLIGIYVKDEKDEKEEVKRKIKIKEEEEQKQNQVNTRRKNKSWPKDARLVHVDRTPCSEDCMQTHSDDGDPVLNKESAKTYGKTKSTNTLALQGVQNKNAKKLDEETESEKSGNRENLEENPNSDITLPAVPDTATEGNPSPGEDKETDKSQNSAVASEADETLGSEDPLLPEIELNAPGNSTTEHIDLQSDLIADNVTQVDTEILEELNEFSSLLTLNDEDVDLPLFSENTTNQPSNSALDLEIAMDNAQFLEAHPIVADRQSDKRSGQVAVITKQRGTPHSSRSAVDIRPITSTRQKDTPHSSSSTRGTSSTRTTTSHGCSPQKGTITITSHVLRKPTPEETRSKKFKCEACEFTGYSRAAISIHYADSHPPCYCAQCGKVYSNPNALARHMYAHNPNKPFECADCNQRFSFESELASHRMKHRTMPSFQCMFPNCGKEFRRMSELNSHVVVHSGKTHYCKKCDYSSNNPRQLRDHQRSHSDTKRYKCKYCEESFKYTSGRKRHYEKDH